MSFKYGIGERVAGRLGRRNDVRVALPGELWLNAIVTRVSDHGKKG
jgi:hypothetical protein